jgi:cellulose synthase/poly-beta-1,6-N-acetylglucosamine synthase-like glycosyltransferase
MIWLLTFLFWLASFLVVYPYLVYPLLLHLLATWSPARGDAAAAKTTRWRVTLIISAFNEETVIAHKLENALTLDFPADRLEIIVASDASFDRTDEIVQDFATRDHRIKLVRQDERRGKSAILNKAVAAADGEIIVFSDANAMYEPDAISRLVEGFSDPGVGYVVGAALYTDVEGNRAGESEGLYWKLELLLKRLESKFHSVVGGDGAIYAIRRSLFWALKDDDISDFVNPLQIIAAGYRGLFCPAARCYEKAGETLEKEFRRKRRIVNRSWRAVRRYGRQLKLRGHGRFLFMLASHKVIRWFALPLIVVAWSANTALLGYALLYTWTWLAIDASVAVAVAGAMLDRYGLSQPRIVSIFHYFYVINLAGLLGIWDEWRGVRHVTWDHIRKTGP